jgi:hypothetical protein
MYSIYFVGQEMAHNVKKNIEKVLKCHHFDKTDLNVFSVFYYPTRGSHLSQVWFNLIQLFQKRKFKCKSLRYMCFFSGVNTSDILTAYIAAIRALRVLDPAGVILELVCHPVRKYLR